jgi:mRNA interferase MazF
MERGEVRWYRFTGRDKARPVLILTRGSAIAYLAELTIAPITTKVRDIPSEVVLTEDDGMPRFCAANLDHVQTVPKEKVGALITELTAERMEEVRGALLFALGFKE